MFFGLVLFQILPLPPPVLRIVSASTYEIYLKSLLGWPQGVPYPDSTFSEHLKSEDTHKPHIVILPSVEELRRGAAASSVGSKPTDKNKIESASNRPGNSDQRRHLERNLGPGLGETWYPLSIAPSLTRAALLKCVAYTGLFLVVLSYPFAD